MDSERDGVPVEHVTVDQVVAVNIRHWRRVAGLTQEELGRRLGWSPANVSAAERSMAEGRDRRRFDAQTLAELAVALGVPLAALLLPPDDDGQRARYVFTACDADRDMSDLMELVVMPDSDDDSRLMEAYRDRFNAAAERTARTRGPQWAAMAARWTTASPSLRAEHAARLRERRRELLAAAEATAAELDAVADAFDDPEGGS